MRTTYEELLIEIEILTRNNQIIANKSHQVITIYTTVAKNFNFSRFNARSIQKILSINEKSKNNQKKKITHVLQ